MNICLFANESSCRKFFTDVKCCSRIFDYYSHCSIINPIKTGEKKNYLKNKIDNND